MALNFLMTAAGGRRRRGLASVSYVKMQTPSVLDLYVMQDEAISWTPTLEVGNGGGAYSISALPTGASINSSTGQITGTLSTLGKTDAVLTYTEGSHTDRMPISFHVLSSVDTTTLAGGSISAPINLNTDNTLYRLQGNLTAETAAIDTLGGDNIIIDLNGYTVTYDDNTDENVVSNADFSNGTTGWNISGVTGYSDTDSDTLVSERAPRDDANALHSTVAAGDTETLTHNSSFSLVASRWYALTFWWTNTGEGDFFTVTASLGSNTTASGTLREGGGFRPGTKFTWIFQASATESATLSISWENTNGSSREFNISDIQIDRAYVAGIDIGKITHTPYTVGTGFTTKISVCNGTVIQSGRSVNSPAIVTDQSSTVDNLTITENNRVMDAYAGCVTGFERGLILNNCTLASLSEYTSNRDQIFAWAVRSFSSLGSYSGIGQHVRDCTITNTPSGGIYFEAKTGQSFAPIIAFNTITQQAFYTNGFGISTSGLGSSASQIARTFKNTINNTGSGNDNGRGMRLGSYAESTQDFVKIRGLPLNQEYQGYQLSGVYCVQLESGTATGITINNPTYILEGASGGGCLRVNGNVQSGGITINGMTATVNASTTSTGFDASCLFFTEPDSGSSDLAGITFSGENILTTNRLFFKFSTGSGSFSNSLTLTNTRYKAVNDGIYTTGTPWSLATGAIVLDSPVYDDAFTESEIGDEAGIDARVSIS